MSHNCEIEFFGKECHGRFWTILSFLWHSNKDGVWNPCLSIRVVLGFIFTDRDFDFIIIKICFTKIQKYFKPCIKLWIDVFGNKCHERFGTIHSFIMVFNKVGGSHECHERFGTIFSFSWYSIRKKSKILAYR